MPHAADGPGGRGSNALNWAKVLVVPVSIALLPPAFAAWDAARSRELTMEQLQTEYVQIAIEVLSVPPQDQEGATTVQRDADQALREWAVGVLASTSPVPLSDELQAALRQGETALNVDVQEVFLTVEEVAFAREVLTRNLPDYWPSLTPEQQEALSYRFAESRKRLSLFDPEWSGKTDDEKEVAILRDLGLDAQG